MNTNVRLIAIANVETGEVKRINNVAISEYLKTDDKLKRQIWYPCGKDQWKRFKAINPKYVTGNSEEFTPLNFIKWIPDGTQKANDQIYKTNDKSELAVLINVNVGGKGYNRKDLRKWDNKTSERRSNNRNHKDNQVVKIGNQFIPITINISDFDAMVTMPAKVKHRLIKGGKYTIASTSNESVIRLYPKDLINKIKSQLNSKFYKKEKYGKIVSYDENSGNVVVLVHSGDKLKSKTIRHIKPTKL